ncbi:MAG: hypothetical protein LBH05_08260 [Deferribacteraceae bacterium]|jgi:hypothetical protein|nr:hypothetical protein [Deferribacteraceae bacterium]
MIEEGMNLKMLEIAKENISVCEKIEKAFALKPVQFWLMTPMSTAVWWIENRLKMHNAEAKNFIRQTYRKMFETAGMPIHSNSPAAGTYW